MKKSKFFSWTGSDFVKGAITAAIMALLTSLLQILNTGALPTAAELKVAGIAALVAGISYLMKNLFTNSDDKFMKKEPAFGTTNPDKDRPDKP